MKKDFIDIRDYSYEELSGIINRALELKSGAQPTTEKDKALALIFTKASTRTNVSFQRAIQKLGGHALYLGADTLQLSRGETIGDTARTLARYVDAIMIRTYSHQDVLDLAKFSTVPVINGLTDLLHPCQAMGDIMSVIEKKGNNLKNIKLAFIGDGNNVCNSLINASGLFGLKMSIASPGGYEPADEIIKPMKKLNPDIEVVTDPKDAVEDADAVYTDVWVSMGDEAESEDRKKSFLKYQLNDELLSHAKDDAIVLHCLPAHRGEEITDSVIDGNQSYVFDQAENRMHIQQSILEYLLK